MSEYREKLQSMMIASRKIKQSNNQTIKQFYSVCEYAAYAAFLSGWLGAILSHL